MAPLIEEAKANLRHLLLLSPVIGHGYLHRHGGIRTQDLLHALDHVFLQPPLTDVHVLGVDLQDHLRNFVLAIVRDATERKRAVEESSRLAAIVESSDDAILSKMLDGTITSWNGGAERIYGYSAEEVLGKPISILVPPERFDEVPAILERISQGESVDHYETVRLKKDGTHINVSPLRDSSNLILGALTVARPPGGAARGGHRRRPVRPVERIRLA